MKKKAKLSGKSLERLGFWFPKRTEKFPRSLILNKHRIRYWLHVSLAHAARDQTLAPLAQDPFLRRPAEPALGAERQVLHLPAAGELPDDIRQDVPQARALDRLQVFAVHYRERARGGKHPAAENQRRQGGAEPRPRQDGQGRPQGRGNHELRSLR